MKITAVRAAWLRATIPSERAHVSDFGRNDSFNTCLIEIDTDDGLTGVGEAKVGVGNLGNYAGVVALVHAELAPLLIGRDPRDITALWELVYNGSRTHHALRTGRTFPVVGRRGITVSALSGIDIALWDLLGKTILVEEPFELRDGAVVVPDRPGLGITLRRDAVRAMTMPSATG